MDGSECQELEYCDAQTQTCHRKVPILINQGLIELYNSQYAAAHNLPRFDADSDVIAAHKLQLTISIGESVIPGVTPKNDASFTVKGIVVGVDERAIPMGITVPIDYVRRWHSRLLDQHPPHAYSALQVTLNPGHDVAGFEQWADSTGLRVRNLSPDPITAALLAAGLDWTEQHDKAALIKALKDIIRRLE